MLNKIFLTISSLHNSFLIYLQKPNHCIFLYSMKHVWFDCGKENHKIKWIPTYNFGKCTLEIILSQKKKKANAIKNTHAGSRFKNQGLKNQICTTKKYLKIDFIRNSSSSLLSFSETIKQKSLKQTKHRYEQTKHTRQTTLVATASVAAISA